MERLARYFRARTPTRIVKVISHPRKVVEIRWQKDPPFQYKCGQYVFVQIPAVSAWQWHPFTISSAPEQPYVSVHIQDAGDWTHEISRYLVPSLAVEDGTPRPPPMSGPSHNIVRIDGPYGAAAEHVFDSSVAVLIGAGVGVTPFASVLRSVSFRAAAARDARYVPFRKAYFYWIVRDSGTFGWFVGLLEELEAEKLDAKGLLEIRLFLTEKMDENKIRTIALGVEDGEDAITGLRSPCSFGRPDWKKEIYNLYLNHQGETVNVFLCGPGPLSKSVYQECRRFSDGRTNFKFSKEHF